MIVCEEDMEAAICIVLSKVRREGQRGDEISASKPLL